MALAQRVDPAPNAPRLLAERALDRMREPWLLGIAALTLLALLLRLYGIGHQSFWYDESLTVDETHLRFLRMMSMVRHHEVTPPLYFVSAWTWAKVFGHGEAGLRALSALAGALMVPATAACAATLAGRRAAVIAGALIATSPLLIWYSQEARAYALFTLLATLSWLFFVRVLSAGNKVDVALWAAASALTIATHYFGIFLVGPEIAWLLLRARRRGVVVIGAAVIGGVGLVLAPVATSRRTAGTGWIHGIHLNLRLRQIPEQLASGFSAPHIATLASYALVALSILLLVVGGDARSRRAGALAAATAALTLGLPLVLVHFGLDYVITRNVIFVAVPVTVLVAVGLAAGRFGWLGAAGAVALCAVGATVALRVQSSAALQRPAWRAVAGALGPGDRSRAIVVAGSYRGRPLKLYLPETRFFGSRHRIEEIDVVGMRSPHVPGCWWGAQCNLPTASPSRVPPAPGFRLLSQRRVGSFTIVRFRSSRAVVLAHHSQVLESRRRFRGHRHVSRLVFFQPRRA